MYNCRVGRLFQGILSKFKFGRVLGRDPTPLFEIHKGIPDGVVQRGDLDPQNPIPLRRAERPTSSPLRRVVILDALQNALDPERNRRLLRGFEELLVRNGRGRDEDPFVTCRFLLESGDVSFRDVSDVDPANTGQEFLFGEDWLEEGVVQLQ